MNPALTQGLVGDTTISAGMADADTQTTLARLARLAAQLCRAPAATVAGLNQQQRWQAAGHGPLSESGRHDSALRAQVMACGTPIVIADLGRDPRFDARIWRSCEDPLLACTIVPALGTRGDVVATCSVFDRAPRRFTDDQIDGLRLLAAQAADAIDRNGLREEISSLQQRERAYQTLLGATHEEALRQLSEALHEGIGQDISGVALLVTAAARRAGPLDAGLATELREITGLLNETIDTCRIVAEASDGFVVSHSGLGAALSRAVDSLEIPQSSACTLDLGNYSDDLLDAAASCQLLRIAQEALVNAVKHSNATLIQLRLGATRSHVVLTVSDNGRADGSMPAKVPGGIGQPIMRYRARAIGAHLTFGHDEHGGYRVRCEVPTIRRANRAAAVSPWAAKHR